MDCSVIMVRYSCVANMVANMSRTDSRRHTQPKRQKENEGRLKKTHDSKPQKPVQSHYRLPDSRAKVSGHLDSPSRNRLLSLLVYRFGKFSSALPIGVQSGPSAVFGIQPRRITNRRFTPGFRELL